MIGLWPTTTIFLATVPTDLRKAYDGLAVLVRQSLGQDPLSGSLFVFCNRRRDRIKILFWEEGGYWLCARRREEEHGIGRCGIESVLGVELAAKGALNGGELDFARGIAPQDEAHAGIAEMADAVKEQEVVAAGIVVGHG